MTDLNGQTFLITGGTSGIGYATAELLISQGARIAITGQNQDRLDQAASALGDQALALKADAASAEETRAAATAIKQAFGALDGVFLNAGIAQFASHTEVDEAFIDKSVDINVKSVIFAVQAFAPLVKDGGSILVNTSVNNQMGMPGSSVYAATKAAARSLVRTIGAELIERGIRVNAVSPGPVETPIYGKLGMPQDQLKALASDLSAQIPLKRFGRPEEIAYAARFLLSTESSFIVGHELVVDGGWTAL